MTPLYDSTITSIFLFLPPFPLPPFVISPLKAHPKDLARREPVVGVNINIQHINKSRDRVPPWSADYKPSNRVQVYNVFKWSQSGGIQ